MYIFINRKYSLSLLFCILFCTIVYSQVQYSTLPFALPDVKTTAAAHNHATDSMVLAHPMLNSKVVYNAVESPHFFTDKTFDFYLILLLMVLLGVVRYANPRYFVNLWNAFRSPGYSHAAKEQLEVAGGSNFFMNVFFSMIGGLYVYYIVKHSFGIGMYQVPPYLQIFMFMVGIGGIYIAKYAAIRFGGWAFKLDSVSDSYIFNVFIVNKILSIALLPFVLIMAFGEPEYTQSAIIVSVIMVCLLFINRYIRSWQVFSSFFRFSKFHFFTYLCASEILPLAVLMKLLVRGMLY